MRHVFDWCLFVIFGALLLVSGSCTTTEPASSSNTNRLNLKKEGVKKQVNGQTIIDARKEGRSLTMDSGDIRRLQETIAERLIAYGTSDRSEWEKSTKFLKEIHTDQNNVIPDSTLASAKKALQENREGQKTRERLARIGKMSKLLLKLPTPNEDRWDSVRKEMAKFGEPGILRFESRMFRMLGARTRYRTKAARQLVKLGPDVVERCWKQMKELAEEATRKDEGFSWKKKPYISLLKGRAEVLYYAERRDLIKRALRHDSYRIRGATASVLGIVEKPPSWVYSELERLATRDPNGWVRGQAVVALGDTNNPDVLSVLRKAALDRRQSVGMTAINSMTEIKADSKKPVIKSLLSCLNNLHRISGEDRKERKKKIFSTLEKLTGQRNLSRTYEAWHQWYVKSFD